MGKQSIPWLVFMEVAILGAWEGEAAGPGLRGASRLLTTCGCGSLSTGHTQSPGGLATGQGN